MSEELQNCMANKYNLLLRSNTYVTLERANTGSGIYIRSCVLQYCEFTILVYDTKGLFVLEYGDDELGGRVFKTIVRDHEDIGKYEVDPDVWFKYADRLIDEFIAYYKITFNKC